eukprot:2182669-Rhodomonas_salina.1
MNAAVPSASGSLVNPLSISTRRDALEPSGGLSLCFRTYGFTYLSHTSAVVKPRTFSSPPHTLSTNQKRLATLIYHKYAPIPGVRCCWLCPATWFVLSLDNLHAMQAQSLFPRGLTSLCSATLPTFSPDPAVLSSVLLLFSYNPLPELVPQDIPILYRRRTNLPTDCTRVPLMRVGFEY